MLLLIEIVDHVRAESFDTGLFNPLIGAFWQRAVMFSIISDEVKYHG